MAYGRGGIALPREVETVADLVAEMDHCGIDEGLVWHRDAWERGFEAGNARAEDLRPHGRLHPTLCFVPTCCDEMWSAEMRRAESFIECMRTVGARAARTFPTRYHFVLDPLSCGDLLDAFVAHSLPVLMPYNEIPGGWDCVYRLMRDFPRLTLILTETGCWGEDRFFRPLMKAYEGFHLTTNRLETAGQLKGIVDKIGPDHLLFGSGLPRNYPGGYALMLLRAEIRDEERQAIAHGNIERLLRAVPW